MPPNLTSSISPITTYSKKNFSLSLSLSLSAFSCEKIREKYLDNPYSWNRNESWSRNEVIRRFRRLSRRRRVGHLRLRFFVFADFSSGSFRSESEEPRGIIVGDGEVNFVEQIRTKI